MYDLGTPCILFGVGPPEFSSKKSRCSGTSIVPTKCGYAKRTYVVFAWDSVGFVAHT